MQPVTQENLRPRAGSAFGRGAHVVTGRSSFANVGPDHKHDEVNHSANEYARYENGVCISINPVEDILQLRNAGSRASIAASANAI